jgi:hypothetical protein
LFGVASTLSIAFPFRMPYFLRDITEGVLF